MPQDRVPTSSGARIGKRVGSHVYVHADVVEDLPERRRAVLHRALALAGDFRWNVAKVDERKASLLLYEDFDQAPFPILLESICVDPEAGTAERIDYRSRSNP